MIIRRLHEIVGTEREVKAPDHHWTSRRLALKDDNMGFSLNDTLIHAGTETYLWYKYHVEAVYCIAGKGEIEDLESGEIHPISEGTLYLLDQHEKHYLRAFETMRMVCIFNPPLIGKEVHTKEGFYPPDDSQQV
jgi:L-ectoine synthase